MYKTELVNNGTSVAIKYKTGVIELYPVETAMAVAMQKYLGIDKTNDFSNKGQTIGDEHIK
jgi:hypothetical protein